MIILFHVIIMLNICIRNPCKHFCINCFFIFENQNCVLCFHLGKNDNLAVMIQQILSAWLVILILQIFCCEIMISIAFDFKISGYLVIHDFIKQLSTVNIMYRQYAF